MSITETGLRVFRGCLFRKTLWEINPSSGYWPARSFAFTAELKSITRLFRMMVLVAEPTTWKACSHRLSCSQAPSMTRFSNTQYGARTLNPAASENRRVTSPGVTARTTMGPTKEPGRVISRSEENKYELQ